MSDVEDRQQEETFTISLRSDHVLIICKNFKKVVSSPTWEMVIYASVWFFSYYPRVVVGWIRFLHKLEVRVKAMEMEKVSITSVFFFNDLYQNKKYSFRSTFFWHYFFISTF